MTGYAPLTSASLIPWPRILPGCPSARWPCSGPLAAAVARHWYRNVPAAGRWTLLWHGRVYTLENPQPLVVKAAWPAFPLPMRLMLRLLGTRHFVRTGTQAGTRRVATTPA